MKTKRGGFSKGKLCLGYGGMSTDNNGQSKQSADAERKIRREAMKKLRGMK